AALERADSDEERARDYEERVAVLVAEHGEGAESPAPRTWMPSGPGPGGRFSREAQGTRDVLAQAQRDLRDSRAAMDRARAQASERRAQGDDEQAARFEREAHEHDELVRAAGDRIQAAEHRIRAEDLRGEQIALSRGARGVAPRVAPQDQERADRIGRRGAFRRRRERSGLRRFRPGPGSSFFSPGMIGTAGTASRYAAMADVDLDREIELLDRALTERGAIDRDELARLVGGRFWGPGRFRAALRETVDEGRAERVSGRTYGPRGPSPTASPA
ncbi:MAG TPA: hypothetical protein VE997_08890, partial [Candidatus Limnocylindria bacterium]|nr:hypothetical protein [Candidatus Limnocylindria bacterium]